GAAPSMCSSAVGVEDCTGRCLKEDEMRWLIPCVLLFGCATDPPAVSSAGPFVASVTQEAEVCGNPHALHPGDWIRFERRVCAPLNAKSSVVRCEPREVERGEVVRVVDGRCAVVRLAAGVAVQPGDTWQPASAPVSAAQTR